MNFLLAHETDVRDFLAGAIKPKPARMRATGGKSAVIQIRGTLTKYGGDNSQSMIDIADKVSEAADNAALSKIVLWVDSGGGTVEGCMECAAAVAAAGKRKPVVSLIDGACASAAYWICSQAGQVFATTALDMIGSIGAVLSVPDTSAMMDRIGVKIVRIRTGELKGIGLPGAPVTDPEITHLQKLMNNVLDEFVQAVATARRIPIDQVRAMATGAIWPASEALRLRLIDGFSDIESLAASPVESPVDVGARTAFEAIVHDYERQGYCPAEAMIRAGWKTPALRKV